MTAAMTERKKAKAEHVPQASISSNTTKRSQAPKAIRVEASKGPGRIGKARLRMLQAATDTFAQELMAIVVKPDPVTSASGSSVGKRLARAMTVLLEAVPVNRRHVLVHSLQIGLKPFTVDVAAAPKARPTKVGGTKMFMDEFRKRARDQRDDDVRSGRLIPGIELRNRLGVSAQALSSALKAKRFFAFKLGSGVLYYPAFYADTKYDRSTLESVSKALGDLPAGSKWDFFVNPRLSLGKKSPLEVLAKGKTVLVMDAVRAFVEE